VFITSPMVSCGNNPSVGKVELSYTIKLRWSSSISRIASTYVEVRRTAIGELLILFQAIEALHGSTREAIGIL
jgi:hypothetical protein